MASFTRGAEVNKDQLQTDEDAMSIDPDEFEWDPSSASFNVDDIEGIVFGGVSSRFWMLRKHLCSLPPADHKNGRGVPFYSWNCITLMLKHRDVDLVINNQKHMDRLLKFLVFTMNTVDGNKNSAQGIYESLVDQNTQIEMKKLTSFEL